MWYDQIIAKRYMDINNKNELQPHQRMDSRHRNAKSLTKIVLEEHATQYKHCNQCLDLHAMLTK